MLVALVELPQLLVCVAVCSTSWQSVKLLNHCRDCCCKVPCCTETGLCAQP